MGNILGRVKVEQSKVALNEEFGKFDEKVLHPGCHCVPWCLGIHIAGHLNLRVEQRDVKCETKTKDNVFLTIIASVHYRALPDKAAEAFYKLSNTNGKIQAYVLMLVLDDVFEQRDNIAKAVEEELAEPMANYGHKIVRTLIVDIKPDANVKFEINDGKIHSINA
ncbi:hypothetical protein MKX03_017057 [Papaver bracteatum]|nr:hypothetical protein MKX03_017057 [Papaver bracteatum]